jgi:hypothetical protein
MELNLDLVTYCGLYCGTCPSFKKGKCQGCHDNQKASWCKIRSCNIQKGITSCAECDEFSEVNDCKKFNNFVSRAIGFFLNSDRRKGILYIKSQGREAFAEHMIRINRVSMKRGNEK